MEEAHTPPEVAAPEPEPEGSGHLARRAATSPEALRDFAIAFRTNAEAIQGVRELQAELVRAVKRQDRSEMVLQSTQALNDTFRNLTQVQRELVKRLETVPASGGSGGGGNRLIPLMLIALLVVFLGGIYVVLVALEQVRGQQQDPALVAKAAADTALAGMRQGMDESDATHLREIERLQEQADSLRQRETDLLGRLDREGAGTADLLVQVHTLAAEKEAFASQILTAQGEILAKRALEQELNATAGRMAVMEPRLEALTRSLDAERAENEHLRKRLAAIGYGLPDPDGQRREGASAGKEPPDRAPPAPGDPIHMPTTSGVQRIDRDPILLAKVRERMNQMLETSVRPGQGVWQVTRITGLSPDRLIGVTAMRYQKGTGKLIEQLAADELEIWVDRAARTTEFKFIDGSVNTPAGTKRFPNGVLVQRVAMGEMTRLWSRSGLLFVRFK